MSEELDDIYKAIAALSVRLPKAKDKFNKIGFKK